MEYLIRPARPEDAGGISHVISSALRVTNAKDYSEPVIARVEQSFSPAALLGLFERRLVFVAVTGDDIIGTASLDGRVVRTVFIKPECQNRGIGRALAEPFYAKLGFIAVRDSYHGEERTIVMERPLSGVP